VLFVISVHMVVALLWLQRRVAGDFLPRWLLANAVIALLYLPWIPAVLRQGGQMTQHFWIPPVDIASVYRTAGLLFTPSVEYTPSIARYLIQFFMVAIAARGIWSLRAHRAILTTLIVLWIVPILLELAASAWKPVLLARTLLWTTIPYYGVLTAGVLSFSRKGVRGSFVGLLIAISLGGALLHLTSFQKEDWRGATAIVHRSALPNDLVLFNTPTGRLVFEYYAKPAEKQLRLAGVPAEPYVRGWEPRMTRADTDTLRLRIAREDRLWLVLAHGWFSDPDALVLRTVRDRFAIARVWRFYGVDVYSLEVRSRSAQH
jgi:hypothetical protein